MIRAGFKCGGCGASTTSPLRCGVCGATLCPDCVERWVEGRAVLCGSCADTLREAAAREPPNDGLEEAT